MFDFGDELIIESYRIPWLVWIQLVVMILLLLLLYSLSISPSDLSLNSSAATSAANRHPLLSTSAANRHPLLSTSAATSLHRSKVGGKQVNEAGPSRSREVQIAKKEDSQKRDGEDVGDSSVKDVSHGLVYGESYHPCNFIGLAKQVFLKCLGLGFESENSRPKSKHGKDD